MFGESPSNSPKQDSLLPNLFPVSLKWPWYMEPKSKFNKHIKYNKNNFFVFLFVFNLSSVVRHALQPWVHAAGPQPERANPVLQGLKMIHGPQSLKTSCGSGFSSCDPVILFSDWAKSRWELKPLCRFCYTSSLIGMGVWKGLRFRRSGELVRLVYTIV